jgi:DNA-binding NtrC family response regulator
MSGQAPVLIVDGNPQMSAMLQSFLAWQQAKALIAGSPAEAQTVLMQQSFRVVLTDNFAPSGDGLALVRYICQTAPDTRVILMAAFGTPALWQVAHAAGAYACLAKPFRLQALWHLVQSALQGLPAPEASPDKCQGGPWELLAGDDGR